jgi:hypothetical protein
LHLTIGLTVSGRLSFFNSSLLALLNLSLPFGLSLSLTYALCSLSLSCRCLFLFGLLSSFDLSIVAERLFASATRASASSRAAVLTAA